MMYFLIFVFSSFLINEIIIKKKILLDNLKFSKHKQLTTLNKKIPFTAGYILMFFIFFFNHHFNLFSILLIVMIFCTGILSDLFKNFSPILRLSIQFFSSLAFIITNEISIVETRIISIDELFDKYEYISILFTLFCIIVLINGTNFIDGVNLNTIGYYIIIYSIIVYLGYSQNLIINNDFFIKLIFLLFFLYILNLFNKTQLGDGGAYLLSFLSAIYLINFANENNFISPYFIILLLWYPCFENLFSIVRKIYQKKSISNADNFHLHQLIFLFLKKNRISNPNNLTGLIITAYNICIFLFSIQYLSNTKIILVIILVNIFCYIYSYNKLINYLLKNKMFRRD
jgi:UDP-N-acetylmuramyl pentapeptide phosphotransferase/UDP-N-acetylglucosamine-1-phosphate transferase